MLANNGAAASLEHAHSLLHVGRHATLDEIKQSYRKAARLYHPDTGNGSANVEKFYQIVHAYNHIIDDRKSRSANGFSQSPPPTATANETASKGKWFSITNFFRRF